MRLVPRQEIATDGVAARAVVDAAVRNDLLDGSIVSRQEAHFGRAVTACQAFAAARRAKTTVAFPNQQTADRHRAHEGFHGPDLEWQVLERAALEDLGVGAILGGKGLRDGEAEHRFLPGSPPVIQEDITQGVPGFRQVDREVGLAHSGRQLRIPEIADGGQFHRLPV